MAGVVLRNLAKRFGETRVIEGLDLEIQDGEFMVLVGPSGCGKSTALRMIAGLEEVSGGEILIGGRVVNDVPPKDRDIAMVFQSYALYPHMTVRENLEFGLRIRKTPQAEMDRLVTEAAQVLGIDALLHRKPKELSGGQRQRVALGRAIVRKPSVFLFDEPLSNLDAKLRVQMRAEIKKLQARLGVTTIYVTHDQVEAMTMGNRIAVLNAGKLQQVGAPLELYERPANLFVAAFIGSPPMNFFKARLEGGGGRIAAAGFSLPVPAALRAATAARDGAAVTVGIRPENVVELGRAPRGESARIPVTVDIAEPLGDEVIVHARAGEDPVVFRQAPHAIPGIGDQLEVQVELDHLHLFDAETQRRL
ncbi:ABC transporter ATP-binding protein [Anaeromyxobacter sp. PSR-1]|uniref:ABC transporter ATP-binding protein n=1 Tax=unclassified Anaeromyxobacter TaxID=2620896 RepID=UPI0005DB73D7|nr:sn-glycerol-3-phosphate ABC transporter ATP-binding protein UgpC [Anaeromyxobacter sp. PSR-1]GAO03432.1 sn-glycerol-3-phosphate import ATP-binding protein UgpC [Anaeromyxobacter sp. PSR-1]